MKYEIFVSEYDPSRGLVLEWTHNFRILAKVDRTGAIVVSANSEGLISLARHLLAMAQSSVPAGYHIHLD